MADKLARLRRRPARPGEELEREEELTEFVIPYLVALTPIWRPCKSPSGRRERHWDSTEWRSLRRRETQGEVLKDVDVAAVILHCIAQLLRHRDKVRN